MRQLKHMWRCWNDNEYYHWYVCFLGNFVQLLFKYHYHGKRLPKYRRIIKPAAVELPHYTFRPSIPPFPKHVQEQIKNNKARVRIKVKPRYKIGMSKVEKRNLCLKLGLSPYNWRGRNFVYPSDGGYR